MNELILTHAMALQQCNDENLATVKLLTKTLESLISVHSKPDGYGRCSTINVLHDDLKNAVKVLKEVKEKYGG